MKKLFYILLIGFITSCQSEERQEKQFLESFSTLMKEKQVFIMGQLVNSKEACYEEKTPQKIKVVEAFYKQYMKAMNDSIHLDSLYTTAQNICIQEGFQFSSLTNRDSLYKFLEGISNL